LVELKLEIKQPSCGIIKKWEVVANGAVLEDQEVGLEKKELRFGKNVST